MARFWTLGLIALAMGCAPKPPPPQATGPVFSASFTSDGVTSMEQAREGAFVAASARCADMHRRFVLVDEQVDWRRNATGGTGNAGTIRYRCD